MGGLWCFKMEKENKIVVFQDKKIRRVWHNNEWYFSVVDVVETLTDSPTPRQYWGKVKDREFKELELSPIWVQLKLASSDGKKYATDCANTENMFRIIQSIPSKKAEPFKQWLAKVGYERIEETEDPEIAFERAMKTYLQKGYSKEWVNQRLKSIEIRNELTNEWQERGMKEGLEYAILTDEITKAWAGKSVKQYKKFKGLKKQNLRDNMTNLELVLNMLSEVSTTEISKKLQPQGLDENKKVARKGGNAAKQARIEIEKQTGENIISSQNAKEIILKIEKSKKTNQK